MKDTAEFLANLVVPVWSVVAALLGTGGVLIGVALTAWNSRQQLRIQLAQQSEENRIARVMALRREVYMEASAAMARSLSALLQLADSSRNFSEAAEYFARDLSAVSKIHVVASAQTLEALMAFTRELGNAQAELSLARIPIVARQQLVSSGTLGAEDMARVVGELARGKLEFAELVMAWARRLAARVPPALVSIRRELDLPLEEEAYREAFERSWTQAEANMRTLLEKSRTAAA
jgi:hypothetical protein